MGFVQVKGGRCGEGVHHRGDAVPFALDLGEGRGGQVALLVLHFREGGVLDEEDARGDQGRHGGVAMAGEESEEIAVDRLGPGPVAGGEGAADKGMVDPRIDRGGVEGGPSSISVARHGDFPSGKARSNQSAAARSACTSYPSGAVPSGKPDGRSTRGGFAGSWQSIRRVLTNRLRGTGPPSRG